MTYVETIGAILTSQMTVLSRSKTDLSEKDEGHPTGSDARGHQVDRALATPWRT